MVIRPVSRIRILADIGPLRENVAFRRVWIGSTISGLGGMMTSFAVVLQVWDITRSSLAVGALGLVEFIPVVLLGLVGGSFADATDQRRLMLITGASLAVMSAVFAAQAFVIPRELWLLYVLSGVQSVLFSVSGPADRAIMPRLLTREQLTPGMALYVLSSRVCMLAGPLLAGVITAAAGLKACYVIDAASFGASMYVIARLPAMPATASARPGVRAAAEGLRYIRRRPALFAVFLIDLDAMLLGLPIALFPALNAAHFGGRAQTLGLLNAAPAIGGLICSVLSGPVSQLTRQGLGMVIGTMIWGAAIAGFGTTASLPVGVMLLAVAGAADTVTVVLRRSIVQSVTSSEFRGRVSALEYVTGVGGTPLGNFESGTVATLTSPTISAVSGGVGCVVAAGLIALAFPAFTRYRPAAAPARPTGPPSGSATPGEPGTVPVS